MLSCLFKKSSYTTLAIIVLIIIGGLIRLHNIDTSTITHPETYVPGIDLPQGLSTPAPRLTIWNVITSVIEDESHPHGFYLYMFFWTKLFGTAILALRMPSVLFSIASIILIYIIGVLEKDEITGLLAAALLAFNGHHIFWSQQAQGYSMACFLGLLSTLLLLYIAKNRFQRKWLNLMYVMVSLFGLATEYYFWPIFATHILWVLWNNWSKSKFLGSTFRIQILTLILASPILSIAAYQSRRPSHVGNDYLTILYQFLQFGFLLEPDPWSIPPKTVLNSLIILFFSIAIFLFVKGIYSKKNVIYNEAHFYPAGFSSAAVVSTGFLMFIVCIAFTKFAHDWDPTQTRLVSLTSIFPLILVIIYFLIPRYWFKIKKFDTHESKRISSINSNISISALLAVIPFMMIFTASFVISILTSRGALLFAPYMIIILSMGLVSLIYRKFQWIILAIIVVTVHFYSISLFSQRLKSPIDYKSLAEQWVPCIKSSDLIFVYRNWAMTPIFYYLKEDCYHLVGQDYSQAIGENPNSRIWILCFPDMPMKQEIKDAIRGYQLQERVDGFNIRPLLYRKNH